MKRNRNYLIWEDEDLSYLKAHFPVEPAGDVADALGISYMSVSKKAKELGLRKSPDYNAASYTNRYVRHRWCDVINMKKGGSYGHGSL